MGKDFYQKRLAKNGIELQIPESNDFKEVDRIIYEELVEGHISEKSRVIYQEIIEKHRSDGVKAAIAGCTEIPLLINQSQCPIALIESTKVHCEMAIKWFTDEHEITDTKVKS